MFFKPLAAGLAMGFLFSAVADETSPSNSFPVEIRVDAGKTTGELKPIWRFFGADEPNYAYMANGKKLLGELGRLGSPQVYFRAHHLLTSGDGAYALKFGSTSAYKEDAQGNPVYDWSINDRIFDSYLQNNICPYVQIGFMPEALSIHPQNYPRHPPQDERAPVEGGQSYPPRDYARWGGLVKDWAAHCLKKYGRAEVARWYWEVWNEPNIQYWHGSRDDFFKLYDFAVENVRAVLPDARVGGPETAGGPGGDFLREFLVHCAHGTNFVTGKTGSPLDFISFHAKGSPVFTKGHVRMAMGSQLRNARDAFAVIRSFAEFRGKPVVIGESDPEGCAACRDPSDAYRNGTMYSSYTAASFPRMMDLAAAQGANLEGALTWAFEFEGQPPFAGFRQLASAGIDLPVLNVFRMFGKMRGQRLAVESSCAADADSIIARNVREKPDVSALAAKSRNEITVLLWHYHDDDVPGPDAEIQLSLEHLPNGPYDVAEYRVDAAHGNSYEAWKQMGSPQILSEEQRDLLQYEGQLAELPRHRIQARGGSATLHIRLPRQGVSLVVLHRLVY